MTILIIIGAITIYFNLSYYFAHSYRDAQKKYFRQLNFVQKFQLGPGRWGSSDTANGNDLVVALSYLLWPICLATQLLVWAFYYVIKYVFCGGLVKLLKIIKEV